MGSWCLRFVWCIFGSKQKVVEPGTGGGKARNGSKEDGKSKQGDNLGCLEMCEFFFFPFCWTNQFFSSLRFFSHLFGAYVGAYTREF